MNLSNELVIGRRRIMDFFGVKSWRTIVRWKQYNAIILRATPSGKPFILASESVHFLVKYDELRTKAAGNERGKASL